MRKVYALNAIAGYLRIDENFTKLDFITFSDNEAVLPDLVINTPLSSCWVHEVLDYASDDVEYTHTDKVV